MPTPEETRRAAFFREMAPFAQKWAAQYGIPASVLLGWMASESNFGNAPSIFGVKGTGTAGSADLATHEIIDGKRVDITDQFAKFNNPDEAFQHMINLVSTAPRYKDSWAKLQAGDWQGFLQGINKDGYATDPNWATKVQGIAATVPDILGEDPDDGLAAPGASDAAGQIAAGEGVAAEGEGPLVAGDAVVRGIISDIQSGGPKKTKDQVIEEMVKARGFDSIQAITDPAVRVEITRAAETAYAEQTSVKSYGLADIISMVNGTHPNVRLTPEQGAQVFREGFNSSGQYTPGAAATIEAEILATKPEEPDGPAGITDSDLQNLYKETGDVSYLNRLRERHGPDSADPWDDERLNLWVTEAEEARQKFIKSEEPAPITTPGADPFGTLAPEAHEISESAEYDFLGNRVTSIGSISPEDAAALAIMNPGDRDSATAEMFGNPLGLLRENAFLGTSVAGPGFDLSTSQTNLPASQRYDQALASFTDFGLDPEAADYRARALVEEGRLANQAAAPLQYNEFGQIIGQDGQPDIGDTGIPEMQARAGDAVRSAYAALRAGDKQSAQRLINGITLQSNVLKLNDLLDELNIFGDYRAEILGMRTASRRTPRTIADRPQGASQPRTSQPDSFIPRPEPEAPAPSPPVPPLTPPLTPPTQPFNATPNFLPVYGFEDGGVVPGPVGAPQFVLAHGGETVLPVGFEVGDELPAPKPINYRARRDEILAAMGV